MQNSMVIQLVQGLRNAVIAKSRVRLTYYTQELAELDMFGAAYNVLSSADYTIHIELDAEFIWRRLQAFAWYTALFCAATDHGDTATANYYGWKAVDAKMMLEAFGHADSVAAIEAKHGAEFVRPAAAQQVA
jgi:hypothetical protein